MILKTWALALLLLCFTPAEAQSLFGYLSYDAALKAMPEYTVGQAELQRLRSQYADEMKRVEEEFNSKYEDFLEVQRELAPTILNKRQSELQQLMERNMQFKQQAQEELKAAQKKLDHSSLREVPEYDVTVHLGYVDATSNLYKKTSLLSDIIVVYPEGTRLSVRAQNADWAKVYDPSTEQEGYMLLIDLIPDIIEDEEILDD